MGAQTPYGLKEGETGPISSVPPPSLSLFLPRVPLWAILELASSLTRLCSAQPKQWGRVSPRTPGRWVRFSLRSIFWTREGTWRRSVLWLEVPDLCFARYFTHPFERKAVASLHSSTGSVLSPGPQRWKWWCIWRSNGLGCPKARNDHWPWR